MSIQVIDRAVRILDVVSENGGATLSAIRQQTALPISTVSRILETPGLTADIALETRSRGRRRRPHRDRGPPARLPTCGPVLASLGR